jgi:hypothetical protein
MAVKTNQYAANTVASTIRGPSPAIWSNCPIEAIREDASLGMYFMDDFINSGEIKASGGVIIGSFGPYSVYAAQGSLIADGALEGGVLTITSGTNLDNTVIFGAAGSYRILTTSTLALNQQLWYETRVATSTITTGGVECFAGLADKQLSSSIPYVNSLFSGTADVLSTTPNLIGFHCRGSTGTGYVVGDWSFVFQLAGGTAVYSAGLKTLITTVLGTAPVAGTFYKLGFIFNPNPIPVYITSAGDLQTVGATLYKPLVTVYVNGLPAPTFLTSVNLAATASHAFPTGFMGPIFGTQQQASLGTLSIDWMQCVQLANS